MCMMYLAKGFHLELKGIMRITTLIVLKCPSVDSLHQNHFGSTLNMYILSSDFQVAMLDSPWVFLGVCPVNKSPKKFCWVMVKSHPCKMSFLAVFILERKQKDLRAGMTYLKLPKINGSVMETQFSRPSAQFSCWYMPHTTFIASLIWIKK